jgi:AAHS family 4-hydroxybenzoate transporter-like MFS transporter
MNQPQSAVGNCLDVQSFINAQPISRYQWRVVILCFLIVFLDGLDTAAMGFIAPALSQDWGIDRASLGPVMSAALIGMVFGALGSGPLADRFGRKVVLVGRCCCSVRSAWPRPTAPTSTSCWCCVS